MAMIYIVANVELVTGCREAYLELIQGYLNETRQEPGCLEFEAAVEQPLPLAVSQLAPANAWSAAPDVVTLIEKWDDLGDFERHVDQPHVRQCAELVKDMIRGISLQILQPVAGRYELPTACGAPR